MNDFNQSPAPAANTPSSQPKKRTRVTPSQLTILEETFALSATPDSKMRKQLAQKLQMPERSIQIWFQNRRAKVKMLQKRALMREEQEAAKARLYAEAAMYAQQPYWLPQRSQSAKVPIQRAWSSDMFAGVPPPPHHHHYNNPSSITAATAIPLYPLATPFPMSGTNSITNSVCPTPPMAGSLDNNRTASNLYQHQQNTSTPPPYVAPGHANESLIDSRIRRTGKIKKYDAYWSYLTFQILKIDSEPAPSSSLLPDMTISNGMITASSLTIGTWHRMRITLHDLVCHYDTGERIFAWHIRDSDYHFKMVLAFDSVAAIDIIPLGDNLSAEMHIDLTEAPLFFMENDSAWVQCSDFTEGMQASVTLRHSIRGLCGDLRNDLFALASNDDHLCQITRFDDPSATATGLAAPPTHPAFDDTLLGSSWRHQSLPLATDFGWTNPDSCF